MIKNFNFSFTGGFPCDQATLEVMQTSYFESIQALLAFLKLNNTGNHIVYGCEVVAGNINSGMMYIDGFLCPFAGAAGDDTTKIKRSVSTEDLPFFDGGNKPAIEISTAVVDLTGVALSGFSRFGDELVFDANYVHTDNNFTAALLAKLLGIEAGAQVNVTPDWEALLGTPGFIANKPFTLEVLRNTSFHIGDFGTPSTMYDELVTIPFPSVGTSDYTVLASLVSLGAWGDDNGTAWVIKNHSPTSFDIALQEIQFTNWSFVQNLRLDYILIKR